MKKGLCIFLLASVASCLLTGQDQGNFNENHRFAGFLSAVGPDGGSLVLPLKDTDVTLEIASNIVYADVRQVFVNDTDMNLEAVYTFPLPTGAAVTDMRLEWEDRVIRSVVKEKQQAKETYEAAKQEGRKTALLEQNRPNLFTTSVANFQPGEEVAVVFSFMQQLTFNGNVYEITFPTTFGPRYFPAAKPTMLAMFASRAGLLEPERESAASLEERSRLTPPVVEDFSDHLLQLKATVQGLPVADIYSNTHDVFVWETDADRYEVELVAGETLPNKDFSLKIELREAEQPQIEFLQSEGPGGVHGLLTVYPPLGQDVEIEPVPREVVFLIDTSGSMSGQPMEQAKEGLRRCLGMLTREDRFNIVRFSHEFSEFAPRFVDVTPESLKAAEDYVASLQSDGGTEMQKALAHVLAMPGEDRLMRVVVFLTDGDVGNESSLLQLVRHRLGQARIFSFGVGSAPNEYLLKKLSETGYGVSNFIRDDRDIGEVMADFFETVNAPVLMDVEVVWRDSEGNLAPRVSSFPAVVPDVFLNRPVQLCYRYPESFEGTIEVRGWVAGQPVSYAVETNSLQPAKFPGIDRLYGKALVDDRMVDWLDAENGEEKDAVRNDIVQTALTYQLITNFTSRVAVEELLPTYASAAPQKVAVPVLRRSGSDPVPMFSATASDDYLWLWIGLNLLAIGGFLVLLRKKPRYPT